MPQIKILTQQEKQEVLKKLNHQFGIKEIPGILLQRGKDRIFLFQGKFEEKEISKLDSIFPIEGAGIYFARVFEPTGELRLSIEGTQILKEQIKKNIFELDSKKMLEWMSGKEILVKTNLMGIIAIKYQDEFLGCGKASEKKIGNFIPKNRRLKNKNN